MSESELKVVVPETETAEREGVSAGEMLRTARENAGLHVAALAVAIKIPVKKLEALEADQLHLTHDLVFTRALASSVCRSLKIDAKPILSALPQTAVRELHVDDKGINAPFSATGAGHSKSLGDFVAQPRFLLVFALCVGALLIAISGWWGQTDLGTASVATPAEDVAVPQMMAPVVIPAASSSDPGVTHVGGNTSEPTAPAHLEPAMVVAAPHAALQATPAVSTPLAPNALKPVNPPMPTAPGTDLVMSFKAKQQSVWVEVVDAKGEVRLRRNVGAGERVECGGVLPLQVVVGRADSVEVEVRGKPMNVASFAKDNVARFEVQ